ncbi:hypothetical protein HYW53_00060 [Candidatus Giovannonibacteria bacterium]|nr:hypothetical protein [Candidatus Giovannonibacteria bacterium]
MKFASIILLFGFSLISLLGIFALAHDNVHTAENCDSGLIGKTICPFVLSGTLQHLEASKVFARANSISTYIYFLILIVGAAAAFFDIIRPKDRQTFFAFRRAENYSNPPSKIFRLKWLSLFENSPSFPNRA